jgi:hypothetical protein
MRLIRDGELLPSPRFGAIGPVLPSNSQLHQPIRHGLLR